MWLDNVSVRRKTQLSFNTLYKDKDEVHSFLQKIEQKHGEVAANMDNVEDLINSGVVQNPRKLQVTCAGLQKSIEKLDDETQEIRTLMQCLQRSWQSMMNMLVS